MHCSSPQSRDGQRQDLNLFSLDSKIQGLESCLWGLRTADAPEVVCWNPLLFSHSSEWDEAGSEAQEVKETGQTQKLKKLKIHKHYPTPTPPSCPNP